MVAVAEGWYPDPNNSGVLRYWDGAVWTEHTAASDQAAAAPVQWQQGQPSQQTPPGPTASLPDDLNTWFAKTFSVMFENFLPLFAVLAVAALASSISSNMMIRRALDAIQFDFDSGDVTGLSPSLLVNAVPLILVSVVSTVAYLFVINYLYRATVDAPTSLAASGSDAIRATPLYIGLLLLLFLAHAVFLALLIPLTIATGGFIIILAVLVGTPLALFLVVKLLWVPLTVSVKPDGVSAVKASWNITRGRFWETFGRGCLVFLMVLVVSILFGVASSAVSAATSTNTGIELVGETIYLNGQPLDESGPVPLSDFVPTPSIPGSIIQAIGSAIQSIFVAAACAVHYAQYRGPSRLVGEPYYRWVLFGNPNGGSKCRNGYIHSHLCSCSMWFITTLELLVKWRMVSPVSSATSLARSVSS